MNRSINGGAMRVVNNSYIGEAYTNQLFHQPSLTQLAQQQRNEEVEQYWSDMMNEAEATTVEFDPMADDDDDDEWADDAERNHNNAEDDQRDDTQSTLPL
jgi:hypothetical protein